MRKYKKLTVFNFSLLFLIIAALNSCVKSRDGETSFDGLQPFILIREGGLANFSSQALTFPGTDDTDTVYFRVNYAAKTAAPSDVTVTIGYDENALNSYNSSSGAAAYAKFPDSIYSFTSTKVTIKAGQQFSDPIPLIVYPSKVDPTKNYMLPLTVTDGGGNSVSSNFGTIYYHLIGNPLAGSYTRQWLRWNSADSSGTPSFNTSVPVTFAPTDPTTLQFASGTGTVYVLNFTNTNGVFSDFNVSFVSSSTAGITITGGPSIERADPVAGVYRFYFAYTNSAGAPRIIVDQFVKN